MCDGRARLLISTTINYYSVLFIWHTKQTTRALNFLFHRGKHESACVKWNHPHSRSPASPGPATTASSGPRLCVASSTVWSAQGLREGVERNLVWRRGMKPFKSLGLWVLCGSKRLHCHWNKGPQKCCVGWRRQRRGGEGTARRTTQQPFRPRKSIQFVQPYGPRQAPKNAGKVGTSASKQGQT